MVISLGYGGEPNISAAMKHQIKLVTTNFTSRKPTDIFAEFLFNEDGTELVECIHGKKRTRLHFGFKIGALNFQKLLKYSNSLEKCSQKTEAA